MAFLVIYVAVWLVSILWIAHDDHLPVVPSYVRYVHWTKEMVNRREDLIRYGIRAALFCLVQGCLVASIVGFGVSLIAGSHTVPVVIALFLLVVSFTLQFPWIVWAKHIRRQRTLRETCDQLTPLVSTFVSGAPLPKTRQVADYNVSDGWNAYHDSFPGVIPVAFTYTGPPTSVVFTIDWETFLAWNFPNEFAVPGSTMPFCGPMGTHFSLLSANQLRGNRNWCVIQADMDCDLLDEAVSV